MNHSLVFRQGALLFAVTCIATAVWLWMARSYAWSVRPRDFYFPGRGWNRRLLGRYVRIRGVVEGQPIGGLDNAVALLTVRDLSDSGESVFVWIAEDAVPAPGEAVEFHGRVVPDVHGGIGLEVDSTRGRLTGASVAGLVVGALGVFGFAFAFRHWPRKRRSVREKAARA